MNLIFSKRFRGFFWTQLLGAFNDNFFKYALLILVVYKGLGESTYSEETLSEIAAGLFILPFFFFSATAGQLADKYDKALLIRRIKFVEVLIAISAGLGFFLGNLAFLLVALALLGLQSAFFGPLKYGIIPQLVSEKELIEGNALVETGTKLAILGGTIFGSTLADTEYGVPACSAGILVIALLGLISAQQVEPVGAADPDLEVEWNPITPTYHVIQMARKNRPVFLSILGVSWFWAFGGGLLALVPAYGKTVLQAEPSVVTFLTSMFSVGIALGAILCGKLSRQRLELGLVPFGSIGMSLFLFHLAFIGAPDSNPDGSLSTLSQVYSQSHYWWVLFDFIGLAICSGLFIVPLTTMIQQRTDERIRSRVVAANNAVNAGLMAGSVLLLSVLGGFGVTIIGKFAILAGFNLLVGLYIYSIIPEFFLRFLAFLFNRILYRMKLDGQESLPDNGAAMLVGNHVSFLDWLVVLGACPRPVRFVMWHTYYNLPLVGFLFRDAGAIPIASGKTHPELLQQAFDSIDEALQAGQIVCLFPEGQLTGDGEVGEFRRGMERVLERQSVPVIPFALTGLWDSLFSRQPDRSFWSRVVRFFRPRIGMHIGEVIPRPTTDEIAGLASRVRERVLELRGDDR